MNEEHCEVCEYQKNCLFEKPLDKYKCKHFMMKQDKKVWYWNSKNGLRHPLDMD